MRREEPPEVACVSDMCAIGSIALTLGHIHLTPHLPLLGFIEEVGFGSFVPPFDVATCHLVLYT